MSDTAPATPKVKSKTTIELPKIEGPKFTGFEMPKFEIPNIEVPPAFREIAEKGIAQAKENYEKAKAAADEATAVLEDTYANASKGAAEYGAKLIETTRANTNAAFDLFGALLNAKTFAETVELSSGYLRKQFDTVTEQVKDLSATAQKVGTETFEPIKDSFTSALKKAA
jgi:phasin